jgi:hypothetical protein
LHSPARPPCTARLGSKCRTKILGGGLPRGESRTFKYYKVPSLSRHTSYRIARFTWFSVCAAAHMGLCRACSVSNIVRFTLFFMFVPRHKWVCARLAAFPKQYVLHCFMFVPRHMGLCRASSVSNTVRFALFYVRAAAQSFSNKVCFTLFYVCARTFTACNMGRFTTLFAPGFQG